MDTKNKRFKWVSTRSRVEFLRGRVVKMLGRTSFLKGRVLKIFVERKTE